MKINRYRKVNKILKYYTNHFGFRKPYQVLLDGTICVTALKNKINIHEQFEKYLDGNVKLLTTQCIVKEIEKLGGSMSNALFVLKNFGQHHCDHNDSPVPASNCILHMVGEKNTSRYIIATQDRELQHKCRQIVGVPLLYFHSRMPTLEAASNVTQCVVNNKSLNGFNMKEYEKEKLLRLRQEDEAVEPPKKRKKKGGPNPLSCKKKKRQSGSESTRNQNPIKKRNRNRLIKKIKNEIFPHNSS